MTRRLSLLATLGALLVGASSAQAAFPGANGLLVLQPAHGSGLVLTDVHGRHVRAICTSSALCGRPRTPRFAPDGLDIVFTDARTGRPGIVAADGTCMWCLLGPQLTPLRWTATAFTGSGQALALGGKGGLWQVSLTGNRPQQLQIGSMQDVAVSARGITAFVVRGAIWILAGGHTHRLGAGAQPSFAPDGRHVAFAHNGWIWSVSIRGGRPARLVRGSSPAFSPDGRELAFIGSGGRVYVAGARGRRAHQVPGVRARSLDWQALSRSTAKRCAVPSTQRVVAQTPEAVITTNSATWWGCLVAIGQRRVIAAQQGATQVTASLAQLAGRFAALVVGASDRNGGCSTNVVRFDLASGAQVSPYGQNCSTGQNPRGVDALALDSSGFLGWHAFEQVAVPQPLVAAACPTSSFCAAGDALGNAATSSSPTGAWSLSKAVPSFGGPMACAATTLCVAASGGTIVTSTNPAGGTWSTPVTVSSAQITRIACPATTLCVAVDNAGNVLTSTSPASGTWGHPTNVASGFLTGISCPTTTLCVAVGDNGDALTSTNPAGGIWSAPSTIDPGGFALGGVSCPSIHLCVATDTNGNVLTSTDPSGGTWSLAALPVHPGLSSLAPACSHTGASGNVCTISDGAGVITSSDPATPSTWTATQLLTAANDHLTALTCSPTGGLCLAADETGGVLSSTNPAGGAAAWTTTPVDVPACGACIAEQVFARDDVARQAVDSVLPGPGGTLGNLTMAGDSTVLSWTHSSHPESAQLR